MKRAALSVIVVLGCVQGGDANGAEDARGCPGCTVAIDSVALLGADSDPSSISPTAASCTVGRLQSGEFVMGAPVGGGQIFVYAAGGGPVIRTIGRLGQGPQELGASLRLWVGPGDTIQVYDVRNGRFARALGSGEIVGSFIYPHLVQAFAVLGDGTLIVNHRGQIGETVDGSVLHVVGASGGIERSFDLPKPARTARLPSDLSDLDGWRITPRGARGFWTANIWHSRYTPWDAPGQPLPALARDVEWFPPDDWSSHLESLLQPGGSTPAMATLYHIWDDGDGHLWTYVVVPDERWMEAAKVRAGTPEWRRLMYDTVIEVLDEATHEVLATTRHDLMLAPVCGSGLVSYVLETAAGDTRMLILEPHLERPGS
jgi:hypothetical protein